MVLCNTQVEDLTFLMAELRQMIMKLDYHRIYQYVHIYLTMYTGSGGGNNGG